jgi:hypothetical protein
MSNSHQAAQTLVELIARQQAGLEITDQVIADALGYESVKVVAQIKSGQMKLPMSKVRALAKLLEVEPGDVMHMLLRETAPEMLQSIEECMGPLSLSPGERRLLMAIRKSAQGRKIAPIFFDGAPVVAVVVGAWIDEDE